MNELGGRCVMRNTAAGDKQKREWEKERECRRGQSGRWEAHTTTGDTEKPTERWSFGPVGNRSFWAQWPLDPWTVVIAGSRQNPTGWDSWSYSPNCFDPKQWLLLPKQARRFLSGWKPDYNLYYNSVCPTWYSQGSMDSAGQPSLDISIL